MLRNIFAFIFLFLFIFPSSLQAGVTEEQSKEIIARYMSLVFGAANVDTYVRPGSAEIRKSDKEGYYIAVADLKLVPKTDQVALNAAVGDFLASKIDPGQVPDLIDTDDKQITDAGRLMFLDGIGSVIVRKTFGEAFQVGEPVIRRDAEIPFMINEGKPVFTFFGQKVSAFE